MRIQGAFVAGAAALHSGSPFRLMTYEVEVRLA